MPTLNWIGKEAVVDHHRHIPTRLLECDPKLSFGDPDAENLLVEGDNLEALKALLPRYRGQPHLSKHTTPRIALIQSMRATFCTASVLWLLRTKA